MLAALAHAERWAQSIGGEPRLSRGHPAFALNDIVKMSPSCSYFVRLFVIRSFRENKKPCYLRGKQGSEISLVVPYLPTSVSPRFTVCTACDLESWWPNVQPM